MKYKKINNNIIAVDYEQKQLHVFDSEEELLEFQKNKLKLDKIENDLSIKKAVIDSKERLEKANKEIERIQTNNIKNLWINSAYVGVPIVVSTIALIGHYAASYSLASETLTLAWATLGVSTVVNGLLDLKTCTDAIDSKAVFKSEKEKCEKIISEGPSAKEEDIQYLNDLRNYYLKKNDFLENQATLPSAVVNSINKEEVYKELKKELEYYYVKEKKKK